MRRRALIFGLAALATCASSCTLDSFLFGPVVVSEYRWNEVNPNLDGELTDAHPSLVTDADRSEGFLDLASGARVHWVFAHHAAPLATIVYSHGRARNLGRYWDRVERLWQHGFSVLIYDYPGFGRSTGSPDEAGVIASAHAALDHVLTLPEVDPNAIVAMGYSLGGGPAYELTAAAGRGAAPRIRALVSESTFCSVAALTEDGSFLDLAPSYFADSRFDNCARIAEIDVPVLIVHGLADDFVVPRHADLLVAAARHPPTVIRVPGGHHSDLPLVLGDAYDTAIVDHVTAALALP